MKRFLYICALVFSISITCVKAQEHYRNCIFLLDWNVETIEKNLDFDDPQLGAILSKIVNALWDQAGIVVISAVSWRNLLMRKKIFSDFLSKDTQQLQKLYSKYTKFNTPEKIDRFKNGCQQAKSAFTSNNSDIFNYMLCAQVDISPSVWDVREISPYFYLLIPTSYKRNVFANCPASAVGNFVKYEVQMGIRYEKFPLADRIDPDKYRITARDQVWDVEFMRAINKLFITHKDISDEQLPEWCIYLLGHGGNAHIAALLKETFKNFLQFLNNRIKTTFLFYDSCFAGGEHLKMPFESELYFPPKKKGESERGAIRQNIFNYTISASTFIYDITTSYNIGAGTRLIPGRRPPLYNNFADFFERAHAYFGFPGTISSQEFMKLSPQQKNFYTKRNVPGKIAYYRKKISLGYVLNAVHVTLIDREKYQIPVVRPAGTWWWFPVTRMKDTISYLSRTGIDVHNMENQPYTTKKDLSVLILESERPYQRGFKKNEINYVELFFPVICNGKCPLVLSKAVRPVKYYLKDLQAMMPFNRLVASFVSPAATIQPDMQVYEDMRYTKEYFIDTVRSQPFSTAQENAILGIPVGTTMVEFKNVHFFENLIIDSGSPRKERFSGVDFAYNGKFFRLVWHSGLVPTIFPLTQISLQSTVRYPQDILQKAQQRVLAQRIVYEQLQKKIKKLDVEARKRMEQSKKKKEAEQQQKPTPSSQNNDVLREQLREFSLLLRGLNLGLQK